MQESRVDIEAICGDILQAALHRREAGAVTYGETSFENKSMLQDAEEELLDLINYSLFAIIKLRRLKASYPTL